MKNKILLKSFLAISLVLLCNAKMFGIKPVSERMKDAAIVVLSANASEEQRHEALFVLSAVNLSIPLRIAQTLYRDYELNVSHMVMLEDHLTRARFLDNVELIGFLSSIKRSWTGSVQLPGIPEIR